MAKEGSKDIKEKGSNERPEETHAERFAQKTKRSKRKNEAEREEERLEDTLEAERGKKEGSLLADNSQEEVSEAVEALIESARKAAKFEREKPYELSQQFHQTIKRTVECFLEAHPEGCKVVDLGPVVDEILFILEGEDQCKLRPMAGSRTIFPLPAPESSLAAGPRLDFLRALLRGLNSMHGVAGFSKMTDASRRVVKKLKDVVDGSELLAEDLTHVDFNSYFQFKGVDYQGEEVQVAKRIRWESVSLSLPEQVGTLDIREFCAGGVLHYINHFEEFLLPDHEQIIGKTPSVMVEPGEWEQVATGLVEKGICKLLPITEVHSVQGSPLLNGMFSVSKQEFQGNVEVCRLIMNLKPANLNCRPLEGDTCTLPAVSQMGGIYLADGEVLTTSSEDIRCFFYLFKVPPSWVRFLCFGRDAPESLVPPENKGVRHVLAALVLPMGFVNSVGIAQHIHRNIVRRALGSIRQPMLGHQEMRRDRVATSHPNIFRVYLDNFDQLQRVDRATAELLEGTASTEVEQLREAYLRVGLPRHPKKSVEQRLNAEVQGAWVNGERGTVSAKPSKVAKYIRLGLELLRKGKACQKELQIVGGGFVYISMYRRPMLGSLNQIWKGIISLEGKPKHVKVVLKREVLVEIARFICLIPLAFMDLRCPFDSVVTASDASTSGGGISVSKGLTGFGLAASMASVRGDIPEEHDFVQILAIGLFDGISALGVALDLLNAPVAGHVSVELSKEANRVVEANFPDTILVESVESIDKAMVIGWALRFPSVGLILLGGGPPCQGVSGLNWDRKGALKDSRSSLFHHVPRVKNLCKEVFKWAQVHSLAENVGSMDWEDCAVMNDAYGVEPWYIDSHEVSLAHRPRLFWISWELSDQDEGVELLWGSSGRLPIQGEVRLQANVTASLYLERGCSKDLSKAFPTFTTSRPSPVPLRRPAGLKHCSAHEVDRWRQDSHRFPPYQYTDIHCVKTPQSLLRPPSIEEREVILGFPTGYTKQCLIKSQHGTTQHSDVRLTLLGNTWSVPVVTWLIGQLLQVLGLVDKLSVQDIVNRLAPGNSAVLQTLLLRPPIKTNSKTFSPSSVLVQKLAGLTTIKGEDILLQNKTEVPVKFHRLRASIPSGMWRWRTVTGWVWTGSEEHINVLELRSVLTTLKWRVEQLGQMNIRSLHLVDSLVVLHALTRGRSSSRKMRRTLMRINSILLACNLAPLWSYVDTKQNPADKPSRWGVKKKWLKVKSR